MLRWIFQHFQKTDHLDVGQLWDFTGQSSLRLTCVKETKEAVMSQRTRVHLCVSAARWEVSWSAFSLLTVHLFSSPSSDPADISDPGSVCVWTTDGWDGWVQMVTEAVFSVMCHYVPREPETDLRSVTAAEETLLMTLRLNINSCCFLRTNTLSWTQLLQDQR